MIYTRDIIGYQWEVFIKALAFGVLLGGCYDVLRVIRTVVRFSKKLFMVSDFIYCVWAAFLIFSFLLNENFGMPRLYIYFGMAAGFCAWYFTVGKLNMFFARLLRRMLKAVLTPFVKIFKKLWKIAEKRLAKTKIFSEKAADKPKSLLKKAVKVVYNILCLNVLKAFPFCGGRAGKEPEKVESSGTEKAEEGIVPSDRSYRLRGVSSLFTDIHPDEHQRKTDGT